MTDSNGQAGEPIKAILSSLNDRVDVYHLILGEVIEFIDQFMEEQGDYSSIELEENAYALRNRILLARRSDDKGVRMLLSLARLGNNEDRDA